MGPSCRARGAGAASSPTPAAPTRPTGPCPATPSHAPAGLRRGRAPRPGWSRASVEARRAPGASGVGTEGGGRCRGPGREGEGPTAAPSPAWDSRPGLPAGVGFPPAARGDAARHPGARSPPYPDTAPLELARPRGHVPLQPQPPALRACRLHPPPGFKLKFPDWGRQRTQRANPAPSWRKPRPTSPARHAPGAETPAGRPRPRRQATPTAPAGVGGGPFPRDSRGSQAQCPAAGARFSLRATLEIMIARACVRGVLSANPGLKCPLNF